MKEIQLSQNKISLIDDEDFIVISKFNWYAHRWLQRNGKYGDFYAHANVTLPDGTKTTIAMHRLIMNANKGIKIDHRNNNTLDNRKHNLRLATNYQNQQNRSKQFGTSRFKGVTWHKVCGKWEAQIQTNKNKIHLGTFLNEKDAATAYNEAANKYFGEFAHLNIIE